MPRKKEAKLILSGVNTHNLKNINVELPKNKITTITGVSGSGKSSLAFDTIYKEGQFRYVESLSSYLRQFFNLGARPDIDYTAGLSPAIAIEQNKRIGNIRSTVGTLTEIDDYLRLLFAKLGEMFCYKCGASIKANTTDQIASHIGKEYLDKKIYLLEEMTTYSKLNDFLKFVKRNRSRMDKQEGFVRYLIETNVGNDKGKADYIEYFYLEDPKVPEEMFPLRIYGIYDRVTIEKTKISRLKEDIIKILQKRSKFGVISLERDIATNEIFWYTDKNFCPNCNIFYPEFTTQHFSSNRQEGACDKCHGLGKTLQVDFDKIIDPYSEYLKAILPWRDSNMGKNILEKLAYKYEIHKSDLWKDIPDWFKEIVLNGDGELLRVSVGGKYISIYYKGIEDVLTQQYHKGVLTVDFQAMLEFRNCPECGGAKLKKESLNVFVNIKKGKKFRKFNIFDLQNLAIDQMYFLLKGYGKFSNGSKILVNRILNPLLDRAELIKELGLGYLSLYRQIDTLSGGEIQRLRLAKQLGNKLTGIIYVLDEPTIGLDNKEILKTIKAIKHLRDIGNTIIVVEHNEDFIKNSDHIIEIGPFAGDFGGEVMFNGTFKKFMDSNTITAKYLRGEKKIQVNFNHKPSINYLQVKKAKKYNLDSIDAKIKLGSFTIITGPSGAGKTTLMYHILNRFLSDKEKYIQSQIRLKLLKEGYSWSEIISAPIVKSEEYEHYKNIALQKFYDELEVETILGYEKVENVVYIDQTSIGKTPRSCPATFIGVFDDIRKIYAGVSEARMIGFTPGHFSFNSNKGACLECGGYGYKKVELQFLPDTYVPCELCRGKRYKPEILSIKWRGKPISEVLAMYVQDAYDFFDDVPFVQDKLEFMLDIGLGYLKMGQPAHTLSGGESQRIKLVKFLLKTYRGHTLYFLDEPTVGLHPYDIEKLLNIIARFLELGDTILMIEHEKVLLDYADEIIRLDDGKIA